MQPETLPIFAALLPSAMSSAVLAQDEAADIIGGNHCEWASHIKAAAILDDLIGVGKAEPMIVGMPNGRALADDRPPNEICTPEGSNLNHFAQRIFR